MFCDGSLFIVLSMVQATGANTSVPWSVSVYYFIYDVFPCYVDEYKLSVIGRCLLFYLWSRLLGRIQVFCDRSLFTTLSMVQATYTNTSVLWSVCVYYFIYDLSSGYTRYVDKYKCTVVSLYLLVCLWSMLRRQIQVYCGQSLFTSLSMVGVTLAYLYMFCVKVTVL